MGPLGGDLGALLWDEEEGEAAENQEDAEEAMRGDRPPDPLTTTTTAEDFGMAI